jgi:WD40 repeat protein
MALTITKIKQIPAHDDEIWHAEYSHDASMLAMASKDKTAIIWNAAV